MRGLCHESVNVYWIVRASKTPVNTWLRHLRVGTLARVCKRGHAPLGERPTNSGMEVLMPITASEFQSSFKPRMAAMPSMQFNGVRTDWTWGMYRVLHRAMSGKNVT